MRGIAIAIFLIACGGGGGGNTDAPMGDASVEDAAPDAGPPPPTAIRVIVRQDDGQPAPGQPIMFQRPDDSVIAVVMTDGNGIAQRDVTGIASTNVSLLAQGPNNTKTIYIYVDAKAGDVLEIGRGVTPESKSVGGMVTLQLPATTGTFDVVQRCSTSFSMAGGPAPTITLQPCGTPTNFLVRSDGGQFYTALTPLTAGQTLNLTGETYRTTKQQVLQITGATLADRAYVAAEAMDFALTLTARDSRNIDVTGGNALTTFTLNDHPNVPVTTSVSFLPISPNPTDPREWKRRALPGDQIYDWGQINLPTLSNKAYANGMFTWTETGTGAEYVYAHVTIRNGGVDRANVAIAGPRTGLSLRMPVYPASHAEFNPQAGDVTGSLTMYIARSTGGWDRARNFIHRYDFFTFLDWIGTGDLVTSY